MLKITEDRVTRILPQVYQIAESGYVYCTLVVGSKKALLIDTGYGVYDLKEYVERVINVPYEVVNTHGHIDHILGNNQFENIWISHEDYETALKYVKSEFIDMAYQTIQNEHSEEELADFYRDRTCNYRFLQEGQIFDLGDIVLNTIKLPGHTKGSIGLLWEKEKLLFAGDAFNPEFWIFMEESTSLAEYRKTVAATLNLPFERYIFAHWNGIVPKSFLNTVLHNLDTLQFDEETKDMKIFYETYSSMYQDENGISKIWYSKDKL